MKHIRSANLCAGGARRWFKSRGLNWSAFLSDGIPASVLGQWGDPLAARAIEEAQKDMNNGG
jgi:hypothetical protein